MDANSPCTAITRLVARAYSTHDDRHAPPQARQLHKTFRLTPVGLETDDYDRAYLFDMETIEVTNIHQLARELDAVREQPDVAFVRGELIDGPTVKSRRRLTHPRDGSDATLRSHPDGRTWVILDIDGVALDALGSGTPRNAADRERLVRAVRERLAPWLRDVSMYYRWSQSAGLQNWATGVRLHLAFWLMRPVCDRSLVEHAHTLADDSVPIDTSLFRPAQLIYTADPQFENLDDPIDGPRSGIIRGKQDAAEPPDMLVDGSSWRAQQTAVHVDRHRAIVSQHGAFKSTHGSTERRRRYAEAWLENAVNRIQAAPVGQRHQTIVREAFSLGGLAGAGLLDTDRALDSVASAAAACGSSGGEQTARQCFDDGLACPLELTHIGDDPPPSAPARVRAGGGGCSDDRTEIHASTNTAALAHEVMTALLARNAEVFDRASELVVINQAMSPPADALFDNTPPEPIVALSVDGLLGEVSQHTAWLKYDSRNDEYVPCRPDRSALQVIAARPDWWRFRRLRGVIDMPTIRPDATLLTRPGYDARTRLYLAPTDTLPTLNEMPSLDDGRAAGQLLLDELLCEFPFVAEEDRAAALAMLVTPVVRHGIDGPCPMSAVDATTAGTGKTTLVRLAMHLAGAPGVSTVPAPHSEEWGKRIGAALRAGRPGWLFDNASHEVASSDLDAALTAWPFFDARLLGTSMAERYPATTLFFVTGNNLNLNGDLARRTVLCRLDAELERPEHRRFTRVEPERYVREHRARFVAAVLTFVRAFCLHGDPERVLGDPPGPLTPLGSYQQWSRLVRAPVAWLCQADPVAGQQHLLARSDVDLAWADLLETLAAELPDDGFLASKVLDLVEADRSMVRDPFVRLPELTNEEALNPRRVSARRLGQLFSQREGRIFRGRRLVQERRTSAGFRWRVECVNAPRPASAV